MRLTIYMYAFCLQTETLANSAGPDQTPYETRHEKTCLQGLCPDNTHNGLLNYRDQLESWNFGLRK